MRMPALQPVVNLDVQVARDRHVVFDPRPHQQTKVERAFAEPRHQSGRLGVFQNLVLLARHALQDG